MLRVKPCIGIDANMTAAQVIERLVDYGIWLNIESPEVTYRFQALASRASRPDRSVSAVELARRLERPIDEYGIAIRRQWGTRILWYARETPELLRRCKESEDSTSIWVMLGLQETSAQPPILLAADGDTVIRAGVILDAGAPVAVSLDTSPKSPEGATDRAFRAAADTAPSTPRTLPKPASGPQGSVWPRVEAPESVVGGQYFKVKIGFGLAPSEQAQGGPIVFNVNPDEKTVPVTVHLFAGPSLMAADGWQREMNVNLSDVLAAEVTFDLAANDPIDSEHPTLIMLEVRYTIGGSVCGIASRPLVIQHSSMNELLRPTLPGDWRTIGRRDFFLTSPDPNPPDLTIEIAKPDFNSETGQYVVTLYTSHAIDAKTGPFLMDLGKDAKTYAKVIVDEIGLFSNSALIDVTLESIGRLIAGRLPTAFFQALNEVMAKIGGRTPAVLVVSAEPYVPWELAWVEPPLSPDYPSYLSAQVIIGRWVRDPSPTPDPTGTPRPASHPISELDVKNVATMAGLYSSASGLSRLKNAELEVDVLSKKYSGVALSASPDAIRQILRGTVQKKNQPVPIDAIHFAGHGDFDPTMPNGSAIFLNDGLPLRSNIFRAANYGGARQPLMFLNACMSGIGGEILGDVAGFPGNVLRGGFGGLVGALWEVDDQQAYDLALEFWELALPQAGTGMAVGEVLRELRKKFLPRTKNASYAPTYLAYVFYGHPRLRLRRVIPPAAPVSTH